MGDESPVLVSIGDTAATTDPPTTLVHLDLLLGHSAWYSPWRKHGNRMHRGA